MSKKQKEIDNLLEKLEQVGKIQIEIEKKMRELQELNKLEVNIKDLEILNLKQQLGITQKALKLAREYMFNVMCAEDVPSEDWFIKCAEEDKKSE